MVAGLLLNKTQSKKELLGDGENKRKRLSAFKNLDLCSKKRNLDVLSTNADAADKAYGINDLVGVALVRAFIYF